jgi:hypothetical protein
MTGSLQTMLDAATVHVLGIQTDMMTVIIFLIFICAILGGLDLILPLLGDSFIHWREGKLLDTQYNDFVKGGSFPSSGGSSSGGESFNSIEESNDEWEENNPKMW